MPSWVGTVVNFVPPPLGLAHYLVLRRRMADRRLRWLAFWCYFAYGGLLELLLTDLFWYWSGAASLGFAFLVFIACPGLLIAGFRLGPHLTAEPMKGPFVLAAKLFPLVFVGALLALAVIQ